MTLYVRLVFTPLFLCALQVSVSAQSVSINTDGSLPNASALLDVKSNVRGVLIPRMLKSEKMAIGSPATGLLIFQTAPDSIGFYYYNGSRWLWLVNSLQQDSVAWKTKGNAGLTDSSFLGNTDNVPINFRVNNLKAGRFDVGNYNYFIGNGAGHNLGQGYVSIGDSAGSFASNNFSGVNLGYQSGKYNNGVNNVFLGGWTGQINTSGSYNVFVGTAAGIVNTTGNSNTFLGHFTGSQHRTGGGNTAVGTQALQSDTTGQLNVAVGYFSMQLNKNGYENTAVGSYALQNHRINPWNVAVGEYALNLDTTGYSNTAIGTSSFRYSKNAIENVGVGVNSGLNTISSGNTYVGAYSGLGNAPILSTGGSNTAMGFRSLQNITSGFSNVAMGDYALGNDSSGYYNVAVGTNAMNANRFGSGQVAVGPHALQSTKSTAQTVAVGYYALANDTSGYYNTAVGSFSLSASTSAICNTAVGSASLPYVTIGSFNTAIGQAALFTENSGTGNTAIGSNTLQYDTSGNYNTAVGWKAAYNNRNSNLNTAIGYFSYYSNQTASENVGLGAYSGYYATGIRNTYIGSYAGQGTTSSINNAIYNTAVGYNSMKNITSGSANVAVGDNTLESDSSGYDNVAVGTFSLNANRTGNVLVAIGSHSLQNSKTGIYSTAVGGYTLANDTSIGYNTAMGYYSLYANTNAFANTAQGAYSLTFNTTGGFNTALGQGALYLHLRGNANTAIGSNALQNDTTGIYNTAVGLQALYNNKNGSYNTSIGLNSLNNHQNNNYNTAIGTYALQNDSSGIENTALGYAALSTNKTGVSNIGIGVYSDVLGVNLTNAAAIGTRALVSQSNSMVLGGINGINGATASTKVGIGTTAPDSSFSVANNFLVGSSGTAQYDNNVPTMMYMFKSGTSNSDRMVVAHSPVYPNWGLQYQDLTDRFNFLSGGTSVMTVDLQTGNVGIGMAAPSQKLYVLAPSGNLNAGYFESSSSSNYSSNGAAVYAKNTYSGFSDVASVIGKAENTPQGYGFGGYFSSHYIGVYGVTSAAVSGGINTYGVYGYSSGSTSGTNYGVYGSAGGGAVNWGLYCSGNGQYTGTWTQLSDQRFKKDIRTIEGNALGLIQQLNPVSYLLKTDEYKDFHFPSGPQYGFVAQELEKVFPRLVEDGTHPGENKSDPEIKFKSVNYIGLIPVLTKAIQEQQQVINDLKSRLEKLEKKQ